MAAVLFLSSDLMFSSRLLGAAKALGGVEVQLVAAPAALAEKLVADCKLVLVDLAMDKLDLPAVIADVRSRAPVAKVIAYGAHVDEAALGRAEQAGCDQVMSRGQFHKQYVELLKSAAK